jgi:hypothetical protein
MSARWAIWSIVAVLAWAFVAHVGWFAVAYHVLICGACLAIPAACFYVVLRDTVYGIVGWFKRPKHPAPLGAWNQVERRSTRRQGWP